MSLGTPNSLQKLQQALAGKSKLEPKMRFYSLYDKVYRMDVLREAWRRVRANKGSSGVDGTTLEEIEKSGVEIFLSALREELKSCCYISQSLRRIYIPKKQGGERPLAIPTVRDRVVQSAVRLVIEPIFEAHFSSVSFGFRPNRSAQQAVRETYKLLNWGLVYVIEADIENCFGTIPHGELMKRIAFRIADGQILSLIRQWLKRGVMEDGRIRTSNTGTPQGGVISPLLANIYLDQLDQVWRQKEMNRSKHNAHLIRYADDLLILTDKSPEKPYALLRSTMEKMVLKLHPQKTRVLSVRRDTFDFLGFNFRQRINPKTGKRFTMVRPSQKAQETLRKKLKSLTVPQVQKRVNEVIAEMNPVLRGWVNYFRIGNSASVFDEVRKYALCRVRRYLRRKQGRHGYGWKNLPNEFFYGSLGLFYEYHIVRWSRSAREFR